MNYIDQLKVKGIIYSLKDASVAALVNAKIQELIGTAPQNLDTLQELAAALLNNDDALEGIITTLASKTSKEYVDNLFNTIQLTPGPKGDTGEQGPQGPKGDTGATGPKGDTGETGATGAQGPKGDTGELGPQGEPGAAGQNGKSAYQSYVDTTSDNPILSEEAWIASLKGPKGDDGQQGEKGNTGELGPKGDTGADGKSAYEIYKLTVNEQEAQPAIYAFESWNNSSKEIKYGEGQAKVIEMRAGGATIEVISNTSTDPNAENFVGQQFNIATGLATSDPIQLYTTNNEPVDIWVTVELVSEGQEAVVAMTQQEWLASLNGTVDTTNFYTKSEVDSNIRNNIGNIGRIDTNETYTFSISILDPYSGEASNLLGTAEFTGTTEEYNSITLSNLLIISSDSPMMSNFWINVEEALESLSNIYMKNGSSGFVDAEVAASLTLLTPAVHRDKYVSEVINELDEAKLDKADKFSGSYTDLTDKPDQLIEDNEFVIAWALNDLKAKYDDLLTRIQALENA